MCGDDARSDSKDADEHVYLVSLKAAMENGESHACKCVGRVWLLLSLATDGVCFVERRWHSNGWLDASLIPCRDGMSRVNLRSKQCWSKGGGVKAGATRYLPGMFDRHRAFI